MLKLILSLIVLSVSGCGLIMLPMLCDAPGSCGQKQQKAFDGEYCYKDFDCISIYCDQNKCQQPKVQYVQTNSVVVTDHP